MHATDQPGDQDEDEERMNIHEPSSRKVFFYSRKLSRLTMVLALRTQGLPSASDLDNIAFVAGDELPVLVPDHRDPMITDTDLALLEELSTFPKRPEEMDTNTLDNIFVDPTQHSDDDSFSVESLASHADNNSQGGSVGIFVGENPELMNLFDPFFDWSSQQMADFAFPTLNDQLIGGFSPLETLSDPVQGQSVCRQVDTPEFPLDTPSTTNHFQFRIPPSNQRVPVKLQQPVNCSVPQVVRHRCTTAVIHFTEDMRHALLTELSARVSHDTLQLLRPLSAASFERCLQRYIEVFHTHVPIIHPPTLDLPNSPAPLVLAMCAIGAVYRMERKVAAIFYNLAHQSMGNIGLTRSHHFNGTYLQDWMKPEHMPSELAPIPLWTSQTIFLLTVFAMLSGDAELSSMAVDRLGFFAGVRAHLTWGFSADGVH